MEKVKQSLESDKAGLVSDLQQANIARQDLERRKKQSDQQIQELTTRLTEAERGRAEFMEKCAKIQVIDGCLVRMSWLARHTTYFVCAFRFCRFIRALGTAWYVLFDT